MSKFGSAGAVLAVAAVAALAGCSASGSSSTSSTAPMATGTSGTASAKPVTTPNANSNASVPTGSISFPVAVGSTWTYQTRARINGAQTLETRRVVSVSAVPGGRRVVMSQTTDPNDAAASSQQTFVFYANGTIGYPVSNSEVSVPGHGVLWPDAAGLASGRAYRSVLRVRAGQGGQVQDANVTVQGDGSHSVTVPAGTFQATLVVMTMSVRVGGFGSDEEVETWMAPGIGPVKSQVLQLAGGHAALVSTEELVTFAQG
jgi:hypothetical protein